MSKPISVTIEEARQNIVKCINEQNLHPSILEPIMKDIYEQVKLASVHTYEKEKQAWENRDKSEEFFDKEEE